MMELELDNVQKPVRKLRKSLKSLPIDPPIEEVHNLRIGARRLDAIAAALMPGNKKLTRRLHKTIRSVLKAAGQVRDMDVLAGNTRILARRLGDESHNSVARLLEHLHGMRIESAHELLDAVAEQRNDARRSLKHFSRQIGKRLSEKNPRGTAKGSGKELNGNSAMRFAAMSLITELNRWPAFNAENLHAFRIKIKELRYLLQLAEDTDTEFIDALGKVKDQIGDWHDWQQLGKIAEKLLNPQEDRATLKKIEEIGKKKLNKALSAA